MSQRVIGISHRVKQTAAGEARPTMVSIIDNGAQIELALETEQDELDFLLGKFPVSWRKANLDEISSLPKHHIRIKKSKGEDVVHVPDTYSGLAHGDRVAMVLGGSGDRFAAALSRRGEEIGATVHRIPPAKLKVAREACGMEKSNDHNLLMMSLNGVLASEFVLCGPRDRDLIRLSEAFAARMEAQAARIACGNRFRQRFIGKIFLTEEGNFPEGAIEDIYDAETASDVILAALEKEETKRNAELARVLKALPVYNELFLPIKGVGPRIAAGIITAIGDIRRFETKDKLRAFAGCHVFGPDGEKTPPGTKGTGQNGKFVRRTRGKVANWHSDLRQTLYLLGDQFNRNPASPWGVKLREYKVKFRAKHPEPVKTEKGTKYTDGHIHKMATWRTLTKFLDWLYREWRKVEEREAHAEVVELKKAA